MPTMRNIFHCKPGVSFNQACHGNTISIGTNSLAAQDKNHIWSYLPLEINVLDIADVPWIWHIADIKWSN